MRARWLRDLRRWTFAAGAGLGAALAIEPALAAPSTERDGLRVSPAVRVIHATDPAGTSATVQLANTAQAAIEIQAITPRASCPREVTVDAMAPFTLAPGASRTVEIACTGAVAAGMKRCTFDVVGATGPIVQFEGVCEGGDAPVLVASTTTIDLGEVTVGTATSSTHTLVHTSAEPLTRLAFHTTDLEGTFEIGAPCTMDARTCDAPAGELGPGEDMTFTVWCRPRSSGLKTAELHIASDTGAYLAGPIALTCQAAPATTPVLAVTGTPVDGGALAIGDGVAQPVVHLRNTGGGTLTLTSTTLASGAPDWSYAATGACDVRPDTGTLASSCALAPGDEVALTLTFAPQELGVRTGTLLLDYEDTAARQVAIPLTGRGLGGTLVHVGPPSPLDFGRVPLGTTSQLTFRLANTGNLPLTDVDVEPVPAGPPFAVVELSPLTVSPASDTVVTATCTPSVLGIASTSLEVSSPTALGEPPVEVYASCEGSDGALFSAPTAIALGPVRTLTSPAPIAIELRSATPRTITEVALEVPTTQLTLSEPANGPANGPANEPNSEPISGPTPLVLELAITPTSDGPLDNAILVRSSDGDVLRIPISGQVATPAHAAPLAHSLGTFCVGQPTTPGTLALRSLGSGALRVEDIAMRAGAASPFVVEPVAPTELPAFVPPNERAVVQLTPRRQSEPGVVQDELVWLTDVENAPTATTAVSATFLSDGSAIAPTSVDFGKVTTHGSSPPRTITLQNCDRTPIRLDAPQLRAPFTLERGTFPVLLEPNEVETIAVGFRPAQSGVYLQTMTIASMQLATPLEVTLLGEAVASDSGGDVIEGDDDEQWSFYGCAGCATQDPGGALVIVLAAGAAIGVRRRRPAVSGRRPSGSS